MNPDSLEQSLLDAHEGLDPEGKGITDSGSRLTLDVMVASQNDGRPKPPNREKVRKAMEFLEQKGFIRIHSQDSANPWYERL